MKLLSSQQSSYFVYPIPYYCVLKWVYLCVRLISWQQQCNNKSQSLATFGFGHTRSAVVRIKWMGGKWERTWWNRWFCMPLRQTKTNILMVWPININEPHESRAVPIKTKQWQVALTTFAVALGFLISLVGCCCWTNAHTIRKCSRLNAYRLIEHYARNKMGVNV